MLAPLLWPRRLTPPARDRSSPGGVVLAAGERTDKDCRLSTTVSKSPYRVHGVSNLITLSRARTPQPDDHSGRLGATAALGARKGNPLRERCRSDPAHAAECPAAPARGDSHAAPSYGTSPAAGIEVPAVAIHAESGPTRPVGRRSGWPRRRVVGWRKTAIDDADACVSTQVLNGRSSACPFDGLSTVPGWEWRLDGRSGSGWLGEPLSDANETSAVGRCRCGRCARAGPRKGRVLAGQQACEGSFCVAGVVA